MYELRSELASSYGYSSAELALLQGWFWAAKQTNTDRVGSDFAYAQFQVLSSTEVRPICPAVRIVQLSTDFGTIRNCLAKLST